MMPRKAVWLVLSCLLAASAILSSCGSATSTSTATTPTTTSATTTQVTTSVVTTTSTPVTTVTTSTTTTPVVTQTGTPLYGGSLTVYTNWGNASGTGFDDLTSGLPMATVWDNPFTEMLVRGDINKYGREEPMRSHSAFTENVPNNILVENSQPIGPLMLRVLPPLRIL